MGKDPDRKDPDQVTSLFGPGKTPTRLLQCSGERPGKTPTRLLQCSGKDPDQVTSVFEYWRLGKTPTRLLQCSSIGVSAKSAERVYTGLGCFTNPWQISRPLMTGPNDWDDTPGSEWARPSLRTWLRRGRSATDD